MSTPESPEKPLAGIAKLLAPLVDRVLDRVMPVVEKRLDVFTANALEILKAQVPVLMDKALALLPMAIAAAMASFGENLLKGDPDIPGVSSVFDLSEHIRGALNDSHPDINISPITDVIKDIGGGIIGGLFK